MKPVQFTITINTIWPKISSEIIGINYYLAYKILAFAKIKLIIIGACSY